MTFTGNSTLEQCGREVVQARLRSAGTRLDTQGVPLSGSPHLTVLALLGGEFELVALHQHRSQVSWMRDYDAFVVRPTGPSEGVAAMVVVGTTGGVSPEGAVVEGVDSKRVLRTAFATAATASTLIDLFDKLQRRSVVWPAANGHAIPNDELCFPRLALCHAILNSRDREANALRMLVGLDAFSGIGRFKERESVRSRMAWHLAYESTLRFASTVEERVEVWRSELPGWARDAAMEVWSRGDAVATLALALAARPRMLVNPPLTYDGLIEEGHVRTEVDAWLRSLGRILSRTEMRVAA